MSDPRNVQHDKKVMHEKEHHGEDLTKGTGHHPQPGKKMHAAEKPPENTDDKLPDELPPGATPEPGRFLG